MSKVLKDKVGEAIAARVTDEMVLGVGTGSTVDAAILKIGERVRNEKLTLFAITSSEPSSQLCEEQGIIVLDRGSSRPISLGFDGADAIDASCRAIKGKGAAMLREKILAVRCATYILIADESKFVSDIAAHSFVPVEIVPEAQRYVSAELKMLGAREITLRTGTGKHGAVVTESGNAVLDVWFNSISDDLEARIKSIVGVVESGLFLSYADEAIIASESGIKHLTARG